MWTGPLRCVCVFVCTWNVCVCQKVRVCFWCAPGMCVCVKMCDEAGALLVLNGAHCGLGRSGACVLMWVRKISEGVI